MKASALWGDAFYTLKYPSVCPCVYFWGTVLTYFCPHFPKLDVQKVVVLDLNIFAQKWSKIAATKKVFYKFFIPLFIFEVPFERLFAPTSLSRMSNIFRDSESLGKIICKKWSQIWKILRKKWSKIAAAKKIQFFFLLLCSLHFNVFLLPLPKVQCPNFLNFQNPWGKVMGRSGLRFENFFSYRL